jgi:hypothetical protein
VKIQAFHKPNSTSGTSDIVSLLRLAIITYLMLWYARALKTEKHELLGNRSKLIEAQTDSWDVFKSNTVGKVGKFIAWFKVVLFGFFFYLFYTMIRG